MENSAAPPRRNYRLVLCDDGIGCARTIEFEAPGAVDALSFAEEQCGGREVELFEEGRSLGVMQRRNSDDYWIFSRARGLFGIA